jgi:putative transposase
MGGALEVMPDHLHLFVSAPPQYSPSHLVKVFTGGSGRKLLRMFSCLAKKTGRGTLWAPSYSVGTAGNGSAGVIRRDIEECQHI